MRKSFEWRRRVAGPLSLVLTCAAIVTWGVEGLRGAEAPPLNELIDLLRTHQHTYSPEDLNRLAVEGLVQRLGGLAQFVGDATSGESVAEPGATVVARLHENQFGYLRLATLGASTRADLEKAILELRTGRTIKGWVLDLRFLSSRDFAAAAQVADVFLPGGKSVMDWGAGVFTSTAKTNGTPVGAAVPLTVLVNHQTRGGGEAIAAVLRGAGAGLVLGNPTAGEVARYEEFALSTGRKLRLAVAPVLGGDGAFLAPTGVTPDIVVAVREEEERGWIADPFGAPSLTASSVSRVDAAGGTNSVSRPRRRLTEADLVRSRREGKAGALTNSTQSLLESSASVPPPKLVRDPALSRALDLLKGLSVIHPQ